MMSDNSTAEFPRLTLGLASKRRRCYPPKRKSKVVAIWTKMRFLSFSYADRSLFLSLVSLFFYVCANGEVSRVRNLGDSCTVSSQCEEIVTDSTCASGVCQCKKGYDRISDNWCESLTDAVSYNLPSSNPLLMCNNPKGCGLTGHSCKTKFMRKLKWPRDPIKVTPGTTLDYLCGLNMELKFGSTMEVRNGRFTVNTLCYDYESDYGTFTVAVVKIKEPPRKVSNAVRTLVNCTAGTELCHLYRYSGFVVGFHVGFPQDCFEKSSAPYLCHSTWSIIITGLIFVSHRTSIS